MYSFRQASRVQDNGALREETSEARFSATAADLPQPCRTRTAARIRKHIVITGTGRCGTTFLVELLTRLGLDTGFSLQHLAHLTRTTAHAGLESDIRRDDAPRIVKSPWFCDHADEVFEREDIAIEHLYVPIRDLHAAAESRRHVVAQKIAHMSPWRRMKAVFKTPRVAGGLWHTASRKAGQQEAVLLRQLYALALAAAQTEVPLTLLRYPRLIQDCPYLFRKLHAALGDLPYAAFRNAYRETVRPEWVHSFNAKDR